MENQNYTATIEVTKSPDDVFNHINDVSKWWAGKANETASRQATGFKGQSTKLNDEFIILSGDRHYSKQKLVEVVPGKKVVWLVTDCKLNWLEKDKYEWTGTKMIFEITSQGDKTILHFTHEGLVPEKECYENCEKSWNRYIKEKLFNFIAKG